MSVSDEMYRRIVEAVPEGIWVVDPQGRTIFSNRRMAEILGTDFDSMSSQSCFACVFPDEIADAQRHFERGLAGDRRPFDFRLRRADGSPLWVSISCMPVCDATGAPLGLLGLFSDLTERRLAEARLRASEERFRSLADTAPVMIWVAGPDKLCTFFNKPWLAFTGRTMEEELGNGWASAVHPVDLDRCFAVYTSSFDARRSFQMEYRLRRADGEFRWILDNGVPHYRDAEFAGYIGSCIDITGQKLLEEQLRSNATALHGSEQQLRALAGSLLTAQEDERRRLSQELHDDVTQRLAFLSIELGKMSSEIGDSQQELKARIRGLQGQALQMSTEVRRLSHGLHPSVIEDFGLSTALEEFCEQFGIAREIHVEFDGLLEDSRPDAASATCLYRVAQESLRNAVSHGRATEIRVELTADASSIRLRIRDNGTGFSLDNGRPRTGLGLISMRERIRLVNGALTIASQPGEGTEISAVIPLQLPNAI